MRLFACEILTQEFQLQNEWVVYSVYLPLGGVLAKKKICLQLPVLQV